VGECRDFIFNVEHMINNRKLMLGHLVFLKRDHRLFWQSIAKDIGKNATGYVDTVGNATGNVDMCLMWKNYFKDLYNYLPSGNSATEFFNKLNLHQISCYKHSFITVNEVKDVLKCQKKNKSSGLNGLCMESLIYGGTRLSVHLSFLFSFCIYHSYMPSSLMESVVIPLVKNQNGDLTDVNNYRAIAIANVETKVFETILLSKIRSIDSSDMYQFSFKQGLSTGLCTSVVKRTIDYYINRGSHIFACFFDFNKLLIGLIIGNFLVTC